MYQRRIHIHILTTYTWYMYQRRIHGTCINDVYNMCMTYTFLQQCILKIGWSSEVVVAQLVEWSLPIPEVRCSNLVICKNLLILNICILSTVYWKDENKEKRPRMAHLKKDWLVYASVWSWQSWQLAELLLQSSNTRYPQFKTSQRKHWKDK